MKLSWIGYFVVMGIVMLVSTRRIILSLVVAILLVCTGEYIFYNPVFVPVLVRVIGVLMLVAGLLLVVAATRLPLLIVSRNSWIVDGVLMIIIGTVFAFTSGSISLAVLVYTLTFWFIYTSILQIWVAIKVPKDSETNLTWVNWLVIVLSVTVMVLSIYGLFGHPLTQELLYAVMAFQFIFLGFIRFLHAFVPE
ncbi:MAG: hypothetical protein GKC53_02320 [Neisseriaceae bacterium]|nr:MAG: hypothetical protein GKC53_02320 [Neisseriaceae bacterium]